MKKVPEWPIVFTDAFDFLETDTESIVYELLEKRLLKLVSLSDSPENPEGRLSEPVCGDFNIQMEV